MTSPSEKLKTFKRRLVEHQAELLKIKEKLRNLEKQSHSEVIDKEKELEDWRTKLEVCQQEKKAIDKEIKEKVAELEKSQLSNTEKQEKINKLLTEHSQELEELDNLLYDERTQYRNIRDRLINKLCEPCPACQEKGQHIKTLENRFQNLKI